MPSFDSVFSFSKLWNLNTTKTDFLLLVTELPDEVILQLNQVTQFKHVLVLQKGQVSESKKLTIFSWSWKIGILFLFRMVGCWLGPYVHSVWQTHLPWLQSAFGILWSRMDQGLKGKLMGSFLITTPTSRAALSGKTDSKIVVTLFFQFKLSLDILLLVNSPV